MTRPLATAALLGLTALALSPVTAFGTERIAIVAAENFYGDVAQQIGGDHVSVTSILANPDEDPHLFEASPSTARQIADARIIVFNGADYDPWMDKMLAASPSSDRVTIVAAALTGHKAGDNPHLWYDPQTLPAVAAAIEAELVKRDPADEAEYKANLDAFDASMNEIAGKVGAIREAHGGTQVTATEPVFGYMASALGFDMLNMGFQMAMMNDTEPSPRQVAAFEDSLTGGSAKILFYNSQVTDDATEHLLKLAEESHVAVVGVTETEPAGITIQKWFGGQLDAVSKALDDDNQ